MREAMNAANEWAVTDEDLEGGGGKFPAKPRGTYTVKILKAETKTDKNNLLFLKLDTQIIRGAEKDGRIFDNYLVLSNKGNAFQRARRNSLYKALGLEKGSLPPGVPGGPDASTLVGTIVDVQVEHEFENIPGEQYSLTTSKSKNQPWKTGNWESKLNADGHLVVDGEAIKPSESVTFYDLSDDFVGLGADTDDDSADDGGWGGN